MQRFYQEKVFNVPNVLTLLRIVLLPFIAWCFQKGNMAWAFGLYMAAMLTDVFDGAIARKTNQITTIGKLLDPVADKLSLLTLLALFAFDGQISLWVLAVMFFKETLMVIGGSVAMKSGIVISAMPIGKATTVAFALSIAARFMSLTRLADGLMYFSVALSMAALIWYTRSVMISIAQARCLETKIVQ